jgi:hypothetical protein
MGTCHTFYDELRFDVRDPHQTHVYVYIRAEGDCPHMIQGWHHKAFPASMSTMDIMQSLWKDDIDPLSWPLQAPPSTARNETLDEVVKAVCDEGMIASFTNDKASVTLFNMAHKLEQMKTEE